MRRHLGGARVGRLATGGPGGQPHVVPVCFAFEGDTIYIAVDGKPKQTRDLKRLRNIAANPAVALLVDHYEDDWAKLWWVRVDGHARVITDGVESEKAIELLAARYEQYRSSRPAGPVVAIAIDRWSGWSGA
ncbi:MAG: TIGR03668 family PPOX class F420-dependent oxidoreductase [Candidatus Dormiibacterota bacterium]|jgi:PPOX class probable F420-dependent enzyme